MVKVHSSLGCILWLGLVACGGGEKGSGGASEAAGSGGASQAAGSGGASEAAGSGGASEAAGSGGASQAGGAGGAGDLAGAAGAAGTPAATASALVRSADGAELTSADGLFTLRIPAGALASDTLISISSVPRAGWPDDLDGGEPLGGVVYDIQPDGLTFAVPVLAVARIATVPAALLAEAGARRFAFHHSKSGTEPAVVVPTLTRFLLDGSVEVRALLDHTSLHWADHSYISGVESRRRNEVTFAIDAEAGVHREGDTWRIRSARIYSLDPIAKMKVRLDAWVRFPGGTYTAPVGTVSSPRVDPVLDKVVDAFFPGMGWDEGGATYKQETSEFVPESPTLGTVPDPRPGWSCFATGADTDVLDVQLGVDLEPVGWLRPGVVGGMIELGPATCTTRPPAGDEVLVADVTTCTRSNGELGCSTSPGVVAKVSKETDAQRQTAREIAPGMFVSSTATAPALDPGPALELRTSRQQASATFVNGAYLIDGLLAGPAFAAPDDALEVLAGSSPVAEVAAPTLPSSPLDQTALGAAAGLGTPFSFPEGAFDAFYLFATGTEAAGPIRLHHTIPAVSMELVNGVRSAPLFQPAERAALTDQGITLDELTFGPVRTASDASIFGAPISIVAGRFLQLRAAALEPATPLPEPTVLACTALPAEFVDREAGGDTGVVCIDPSNTCRVTNDTFEAVPLLASQCESYPAGARAAVFGENPWGAPVVSAGPGWSLVWTTAPKPTGNPAPTLGLPESIITRRVLDQLDYRIDFTLNAGAVLVSSVALHTGPLPPYGQAFDCGATPLTMSTPHDESGVLFFARVCANLNAVTCELHGDIESTPQTESCSVDYAVALGVSPSLGPFATAGWPNGTWAVTTASEGTHDGQILTGFPVGTPVSLRVEDAMTRYFIVDFTYTGSEFVVHQAYRL